MTVLNNAFMAGLETDYGQPSSLTNGIEVSGHSVKLERAISSSVAPRPGAQGEQADRNIIVNNGGAGSFTQDVLTKGFGFWMQTLLGPATAPAQIGTTTAYESTATTAIESPDLSYTLQALQHDVASSENRFTHLGSVIHRWTLSHTIGSGNLALAADFVSQDVVEDVPAGIPEYPVGAIPYDGEAAVGMFTIDGGGARCVRSFELTAELGYLLNRKCLDGTTLLKRPERSTYPMFTGKITMEWNGNDLYEKYKKAESVPIVGLYSGDEIEPGHNHEFGLSMPSCLITSDPIITHNTAGASDVPMMEVEFKVQHDAAAGDMLSMRYKSTDTAF